VTRLAVPPGLRYVLGRIAQLVPTLAGVTLFAFIVIRLSGDPTSVLLPADASETERAAFRRAYGLDRPILEQYVRYVGRLVHGDFGVSLFQGEPALRLVLDRLAVTVQLAATAIGMVVLIGVPIGILAAVRRGTIIDHVTLSLVALGQSVATFWLGLMLILVFAVAWRLVPPSGYGTAAQIVLPAFTLAAYYLAVAARLTRSGMLEVLAQDYIRTARAKGLSEWLTVCRHALRNAFIPILTVLGIQIGDLLAGSVVTETVFAWPGVGTLVLDAILRRDYPLVQAVIVVLAVIYAVVNLAVDLLYAWVDPRVRYR
jgi:peptide/nickel transport system permease protein